MKEFKYIASGLVENGNASARKGGYPTANLAMETLPDILQGIYLGYATIENEEKIPSIIFFGIPYALPDIKTPRFEVHLLNQALHIYGKKLTVELVWFVRENKKFEDVEGLHTAIEEDMRIAREYFNMSS